MKSIKHSKFKNTGFIFELLIRQITSEIMSGKQTSSAERILKEFFSAKRELSKELKLYQYLINERYNSESKAEKFIDTICEARKRLDEQKLLKEKYNLVKIIKESYNIDEFVKSPISNYKTLASIYKLFEVTTTTEQFEPKDIVNSRFTIVENIINSSIDNKDKRVNDKVLEEYRKQDEGVRLLSYKMLIEGFNKKYSNLSDGQKSLLKEYINNVSNTGKLKEYVNDEVNKLCEGLKSVGSVINDKVTKIKLAETIANLKKIKSVKVIKESHLSAMMMSYELLKELKEKVNIKEAKKYSIGSGYLGNGLTYWNREEEENGDYKTVAHIDKRGNLTIMDKGLPSDIVKYFKIQADMIKNGGHPPIH